MKLKIVHALFSYIQTLYCTNQNFLKLCGTDVIYDTTFNGGNFQNKVIDVIQDIPKLIPYSYSRIKNTLFLQEKDGLLEFNDKIDFLKSSYEEMLKNHSETLKKVKEIRDKYVHKMHDIEYSASSSGNPSLFSIEFKTDGKVIKIYAGELLKLLKELNSLFSKIITEITNYLYQNNYAEHGYYQRISRFDFNYFSEIYESDLLRKVGLLMQDF